MEKYDHYYWNTAVPFLIMTQRIGNLITSLNNYFVSLFLDSDHIASDKEICDKICTFSILLEFEEEISKMMIRLNYKNGYFVKMHRAPKDSNWDDKMVNLKNTTGMDVLIKFVKSIRICDDLKNFSAVNIPLRVYFQEFVPVNPLNEFRMFASEGGITNIRHLSLNVEGESEYNPETIFTLCETMYMNNFCKQYPKCAIDFVISRVDKIRILEINPFDSTTDLYIGSTEIRLEQQ